MDDAELAALDFCYLTTTGRRSGHPHTIEIWFAMHERTLYLLAGGGDASDWVRNIRAHPTVGLRLGDRDMLCAARVVEDPAEDELARSLVHDKYRAGYSGDLQEWRRTALPVAVEMPVPG